MSELKQWRWVALDTILVSPEGGKVLVAPGGVSIWLAKKIAAALNTHDANSELVKALRAIVKCYGVGYKDAVEFCKDVEPFMEEARTLLARLEVKP